MTHRKGSIWTERLLLGLILVSVAATLNLLLVVYRQAPADQPAASVDASAQSIADVTAPAAATETREAPPAPSADQIPPDDQVIAQKTEPPPAEDPTQKAVGALAIATTKEIEAAGETDRRTLAMEAGLKAAVAESERWKRRELLVRQQIAGIAAQADRLEHEADALEAERDVLEHERDATKAALTEAGKRSGFAVLPYKGPNGTWRRPIVIECVGGEATLQPHGPRFTTLDLSPRIHPRSSIFVKAIARELLHIRSAETPDGTPAVPYIVFLVRPDGVVPYYLARTCLEPLGIAFGYELVDQKLAVNIPDYDDLTTWDGSTPLDLPLEKAPGSAPSPARLARADQNGIEPGSPPAGLPDADQTASGGSLDGSSRLTRQGGQRTSGSGYPGPEDFVWPGRARPPVRDGGGSPSPSFPGEPGNQVAGGGADSQPGDHGSGGTKPETGRTSLEPFPGRSLSSAEGQGLAGIAGKTGGTGTAEGQGLAGIVGKTGGTRTSASADAGSGRTSAPATAGQGFADHPGGSGSGMAGSAVNSEDIGTGTSADAGSVPFSTGSQPVGGLAGGQNGLGGGSAGTGGLFQLPDFEPAGDQAGISPSLGPAGTSSAGGSLGVSGAGGQSPSFGLGQSAMGLSASNGGDGPATSAGSFAQSGGALPPDASGSRVAGTLRVPSANLPPDASGSGVAGTLNVPSATTSTGASGSGVAGTLSVPSATSSPTAGGSDPLAPDSSTTPDAGASQGAGANPRSGDLAPQPATRAGSTNMGERGGRVQGFDWDQAAKDGPQSGGMGAPGSDPALDAQPPALVSGLDDSAGAPANPPPAAPQNQSTAQPSGRTGLQPGTYQGGQYSQQDINKAQALSGLSSLVSPSLAEKLAGATSSSTDSGSSSPSTSTPSTPPSNSQTGGMPLGGTSQPSPPGSTSSSLAFGPNLSPSSDPANEFTPPPRPKEIPPMGSIEVRFEIVVVCRKDEVVLHPGSYRLTSDLLRSRGQGEDSLLSREIRAMVRNRAMVDPMIRQKPALRFLVESQGADTFAIARRQLLFSLPDWPISLQVAGSQDADIFSRKPW